MEKSNKQSNMEAKQVSKASILSMFKKRGIFRKFILITAIILFMSANGGVSSSNDITSTLEDTIECIEVTKEEIFAKTIKNRMHENLIKEVDSYIKRIAPTSGLDAETLVLTCEKYELDVVFVMAQALIESHFGTRGKAAETNSVWNVGTYDNGVIKYTYGSPNESIEPYAKLLYDKYLLLGDTIEVNDKDVLHLLQDKGYTNYKGKRFASAKGYENAIRKLMVKIDIETSISMLEDIKGLDDAEISAFFGPSEDVISEEIYALN